MAELMGSGEALNSRWMAGMNDHTNHRAYPLVQAIEAADRLESQPDLVVLDEIEDLDTIGRPQIQISEQEFRRKDRLSPHPTQIEHALVLSLRAARRSLRRPGMAKE